MLRDRDKNKLAVEAIELFKNKAELCENQRRKIAKLPGDGDNDDSLFKGTSATGVHLDLPGPSTSAGSGGAIAKRSPTSTPTGSKGINRLFAYCKGGNFNIHIWAWFGFLIC